MFWKSFYEDNIQPEIQVPSGEFINPLEVFDP